MVTSIGIWFDQKVSSYSFYKKIIAQEPTSRPPRYCYNTTKAFTSIRSLVPDLHQKPPTFGKSSSSSRLLVCSSGCESLLTRTFLLRVDSDFSRKDVFVQIKMAAIPEGFAANNFSWRFVLFLLQEIERRSCSPKLKKSSKQLPCQRRRRSCL